MMEFELTKEYRDRFQQALDEKDDDFIIRSLESVQPADISALLHEFNSEESKYVLDRLGSEIGAEIIRDLDSDSRQNFLKIYSPEETAHILNFLNSDDAADILHELAIQEREEVLAKLDAELRLQVVDLLRYEANVAGGLMAKELIKVRENWTVNQCIDEIRKQAENVDKFYAVYVVDQAAHGMGRVSLKMLVLANANRPVAEIID
ncbi:MAG: magnesium transporter MgtE N-terminal domain-containing protein, partial [Chryseotalea sp.]